MDNERLFSTCESWLARRVPNHHVTDRLGTRIDASSLVVCLSPTAGLRFDRDRAQVRLLFGRSGAGPDVSFQPAAVDRVVRDQARLAGVDPNRWSTEVLGLLVNWNAALGWVERGPHQLVAAVGAFTHPLLCELYQAGRSPLGEVPRWASPILRAPDAREAASRLTRGPANRRVTRALATALAARTNEIDFERLAAAVAAAGLVTDDELANLLEVPPGEGPIHAPLAADKVRAIRTGLGWYPADRRAALLTDAARHHRVDDLARAMGRLRWVIDSAPRPLPVRLSRLEELCARMVPVVAARHEPPPRQSPPVETPTGAGARRQNRGPARRRSAALWEEVPHPAETAEVALTGPTRQRGRVAQVPLGAPAAPATAPQSWPVHPKLLAVSEHRVGELTLCVPTSLAELASWSRRLNNCLDTFGPAVAHGRSWVIGIRSDDEWIGAVEICPATHRLRQAQGPRNRPLPAAVHERVIAALGELNVLRPSRRS